MPRFEAQGVGLHYRWDGPADAPVLVLVHSLGAALDMWFPQVAAFAARFRVLRCDVRGHGASSVPPGPYRLEHLGTDVLQLLDHLRVERAHYCGLSMGGTIGMWLAAHAPERIARLVLSNTSAYFGPPETMNARIALVSRDGMPAVTESVIERWFTPGFRVAQPEAVQRIRAMLLASPPDGYVACCAALRDLDERPDLPRIVAPTLVITGTADPSAPPGAAAALTASIRGARLVELQAAHLSNVEAADAFTAAVLDFLSARA